MKNEIKDVSLAFCCKENWNEFPVVDDRTRHCASCKHKVIDFTHANQAELNESLKSGERVCGRFKSSQLSQAFLKIAAATLITTAVTSCSEEPVQIESPIQIEEIDYEIMGDFVTVGFLVEMPDSVLLQVDTTRIK